MSQTFAVKYRSKWTVVFKSVIVYGTHKGMSV